MCLLLAKDDAEHRGGGGLSSKYRPKCIEAKINHRVAMQW